MNTIEKFWNDLIDSVSKYLPDLGAALVIMLVGILIAFFVVKITRKALQRRNVDPSLSSFICRAVRILIYVFTVFAAMSSMHISITGLVAFFSAAAAAIALALQGRLSDIASGIVILFTKPFVTGDFIEFGKYQGFVQKIDLFHTNILTYDGTNVIIPNSSISASEINNYTQHPQIRVTVDVPVPYDADIKQVKDILFDVMEHTELILRDEQYAPKVRLEKFGDSALEFTTRCFCDYKDFWTVYYSLTENIKNAFDQNGIIIPFNQLDVHLEQS